ncbi:MAG: hypothetical protein OEQ53_07295 [Saprospiraceae bacterium]|nr:hypothetical protein [Saprospiraceae bacterium]
MNDRDWIDYLYGEMTEEDVSKFEERMDSDPVAQKKLESFRQMRFLMHQHEDVKPTGTPMIVVQQPKSWLRWTAIAASLLVLLVAGRLLDFRVSVDDGLIQLSYGQAHEAKPNESVILAQLNEQKNEWQSSINMLRSDLQLAMQQMQANSTDQPTTKFADYRYVESALHDLQGQNQQMADQLVESLRREQNENTEALINDLLRYWDEQRKADLQLVNDGLQNLAQSIQLSSDTYAQLIQQPFENY